jgi:hypothetical protein
MPSPPNVIQSKYTDKQVDTASPKLQGWSIEGLTVLIGDAMILPLQDLPRTVMI